MFSRFKLVLKAVNLHLRQRAIRVQTESNQRAIREQSENNQRTIREHSEGTQRALRWHSERNESIKIRVIQSEPIILRLVRKAF